MWAQAGSLAPEQPNLAAEMDQAFAAKREADALTFFAPIRRWWNDGSNDPAWHEEFAPYAVLFLDWEAHFPDEWREAGSWGHSPWGAKEGVLRRLIRKGVPVNVKSSVEDLVVAAVTREYRCKDWMYAALVRLVDEPSLRDRLGSLLASEESLTKLRTEFVLHVLDSPGVRVKRATWQRWLAG
ncbi:MAG TPA: hypothetical protein DGG94_04075 [Micromonosporaceae bacterium]|nr:hypothetical protein [Micromonosporaceae bacterium]HCU48977.1 hypothetical protein [Micromonosporaceae bacterium]